MTASTVLVLVANAARPDPEVPLADLPGKGGRFDLVARFVNAALLTSHGIRDDVEAWIAFTQCDEPAWLRVQGAAVTGVGPDERSTAARLLGALTATPMPVWQPIEDGIELRSGSLEEVLADAPEPRVLMHEEGEPLRGDLAGGTFVVGDHEGFTAKQLDALAELTDVRARLGATALQADHVAAVLHHEIDR